MNLEKTVNHGGHSEHGAKTRAYVGLRPITHWVATKKGLKLKLFAVPAVLLDLLRGMFAVVELRF